MKVSKWIILLLVFALLFTLSLSGCAQDEEPEDQDQDNDNPNDEDEGEMAENQLLKVNLSAEPPCLDPQLSTDTTSSEILQDTLEGIIRMDQSGQVVEGSGMAESWDISEDGTVYTFHLRDAKWDDGTPVTAGDFEYGWKRLLNPDTASDYTFMAYDIVNAEEYSTGTVTNPDEVGVKATDDKTLEVTLKAPNPVFISKLQHSTFFPSREDLVDEYGDRYASEANLTPSCGPFKVTEWAHESKIVLEKNDEYWDADAVKLDRVEFSMLTNSNSLMGQYKTEQLDYVTVPSQFLDQYKDELQRYNTAATYYYLFNNENEYLKNTKLRKAIRMAIDQTKVYDTLAQGMTDSAYAWIPPGIPGYDGKTFREIAGETLFDDIGTGATKDEVVQLVEEAASELGVTADDLDGKISYLTGDTDSSLKYGEVYQQMISENAGLDTGIEQATWKVRLDRFSEGDFTMAAMGWIGDYNDAMTFMDLFLSDSPQNRARYKNEEFDSYVHDAMEVFDQKERVDAMVAAEKIFIEDMPIAPYSYGTEIYVQRPYVKDIVRLPLQVYDGKKWAYVLEH
ncbi:peptide ABC transporter substrate-binding protein [Sporosalibacterium faouarense]|uniref:peptide ABC transporter substrate-binding protein n=1 Tax=Sporosalibacterium faouarense TaxID=516123 RepID=UPI00141C033D|nr:peptide ABC transporter substrate-binding protein [Sporosalibacterium faouarense]MTI46698.1 peptide ABC transporter substrate-binding protein [Bacillota bacterium]